MWVTWQMSSESFNNFMGLAMLHWLGGPSQENMYHTLLMAPPPHPLFCWIRIKVLQGPLNIRRRKKYRTNSDDICLSSLCCVYSIDYTVEVVCVTCSAASSSLSSVSFGAQNCPYWEFGWFGESWQLFPPHITSYRTWAKRSVLDTRDSHYPVSAND